MVLHQHAIASDGVASNVSTIYPRVGGKRLHMIEWELPDVRTTHTKTFDEYEIARARNHERAKIEYLTKDPTISRVAGTSASTFGWLLLIPGAAAALGLVCLTIGALRARAHRALYVNGTVAEARVTSVYPDFFALVLQQVPARTFQRP